MVLKKKIIIRRILCTPYFAHNSYTLDFGHCEMSLKISGTYLPSLNNYEIFSILKKAKVRILTLIMKDVSPCEMKNSILFQMHKPGSN
jgi:hypothetical protein